VNGAEGVGRRYLWRDLVALRRAQAMPAAQQPALFALREDHRPAGGAKGLLDALHRRQFVLAVH
jgi:hypothetical protein